MPAKLSGPEFRQKLEQSVRRMSKWMWLSRIVGLALMGLFLIQFYNKRPGQAAMTLFIFMINFVIVIRHDLVVLMLRLLPQRDETSG